MKKNSPKQTSASAVLREILALINRTNMGHRQPRLMDPLLRKTGPLCWSPSRSTNRPLLAVRSGPPFRPPLTTGRSDGPQPHKLNVLFPKRVQIKVFSVPTPLLIGLSGLVCISITCLTNRIRRLEYPSRRGQGYTILQKWKYSSYISLEAGKPFTSATMVGSTAPPGGPWKYKAQGSGLILGSGVIKAFLVQITILANHQNGKDTHLRGVKIFAPGTEHSTSVSTGLEGPWLDEEQQRMFSIRWHRVSW